MAYMGIGTSIRLTCEGPLRGVTGVIVGHKDGSFKIHMDKSWEELGSVNPGFRGHICYAEHSAFELYERK